MLLVICEGICKVAFSLTRLLRKEESFHLHDAQEKSFQELRRGLSSAPVLAFPDYSASFVLYTDASAKGIRAVFMQQDDRGKNLVIAYSSRTLNPADSNYAGIHVETLPVVLALKHYRENIFGYPVTVTLLPDHAAVTELLQGLQDGTSQYRSLTTLLSTYRHEPMY